MSSKDDRRPEEEKEEVGAIDPRRGPVPTEAPEDERIDTRDLEADRKESDETENKDSPSVDGDGTLGFNPGIGRN